MLKTVVLLNILEAIFVQHLSEIEIFFRVIFDGKEKLISLQIPIPTIN